jgi:hypothetical protein
MKKLLVILVLGLLWNGNLYAERTFLICQEVNKSKIDTYSFDNEFVYSGAAKYKIVSNTDTIYASFENDPSREWGFISINRISGTLERAHGLVMPGEKPKSVRMMKKNKLFEIFYNCQKTEKKF